MPRFAYQTARRSDAVSGHFCSVTCRLGYSPSAASEPSAVDCANCNKSFSVQYAFQVVEGPEGQVHACSEPCRMELAQAWADNAKPDSRVIAVLNQKGGTGKTTTAVALAAGLAERGARILLVDADPQGNIGVSLGVRAPRGLYHVLVDGADPAAVAVEARPNLWAVTSDRSLCAAELVLAKQPDRDRIMARRFAGVTDRFDYILIDCAPSVTVLGYNTLAYARELIVPVSCDYLALVGVKQVLRTVRFVNETLDHPVRVLGVLPTFFDGRNRISRQAVEALGDYFGDRLMPSVRIGTAFKKRRASAKRSSSTSPRGKALRTIGRSSSGSETSRRPIVSRRSYGRRRQPRAEPAATGVAKAIGSVLTSEL